MTARLRVAGPEPTSGDVLAATREILSARDLLVMASYSVELGPRANSAFFAVGDDLVGWFVSERTTRHSSNLDEEPRVSATVFLDPPTYGEQLRGVQLFGVAREAGPSDVAVGLDTYRAKFPDFAQEQAVRDHFLAADGPAVLYRFEINRLVVLDEPRFGRRVYVAADVHR